MKSVLGDTATSHRKGIPLAYDYTLSNQYYDLHNQSRSVQYIFDKLRLEYGWGGDYQTDQTSILQYYAGFGWSNDGIEDWANEHTTYAVICEENVNCKDLSTCDSVTQQMCTALPSLHTNCPMKCECPYMNVPNECPYTCKDTPECPEDVLPAVCELLSDEDKQKCNQTCGLCEEVTIQAYVVIEKGGDCKDKGLQYINEKDCKEAAEQRGLDFNTETDRNYPVGCYKHSNSVYFNFDPSYGHDISMIAMLEILLINDSLPRGIPKKGTTEYRSAPICR